MRKIFKVILFCIAIAIIVAIICNISNIKSVILKNIYPKKYNDTVEQYAIKYNVDPLMIYSIIKAESNFKPNAKSTSGAQGLMQIMEETAQELDENEEIIDLFDTQKNIEYGTKYYSILLQKYNNITELALAAYNAGMGNVDNWIEKGIIKYDGSNIENIPYKETNMYVRKILNNYRMYQELYKTKERVIYEN